MPADLLSADPCDVVSLKGMGLPNRYRLFFRPFEVEGRRLLLILWLGFPRKEDDRNHCYAPPA